MVAKRVAIRFIPPEPVRVVGMCFAHDVIDLGERVVIELDLTTCQLRVRLATEADVKAMYGRTRVSRRPRRLKAEPIPPRVEP